MVLEQDHRRLNKVVEIKTAIDAELADFHENERMENWFVIEGFPRISDDLIGKARALEMALLGEKIPAKTALDWGLVNRVVPDEDLMSTAQEIARSLAEGPWALGSIRKLIWDSLDNQWLQQLHAERVAQRTAGRTSDFREGVMAFLQKRVAVFTRK